MFERLLRDSWMPAWMRRDHPLVRWSLRKPRIGSVRYVVFGSALGLYLLFGGLSLPLVYLFLWLVILVQQAVSSAGRIHEAQAKHTWDLLRAAPFDPRELLLSTWAGGFWQLNSSWVMNVYRVLQGIAVIAVMVFGLWFAEFPVQHAVLVLAVGLVAIIVQPLAEVYFSGMVGALCAGWIRGQAGAVGAAALAAAAYWCCCIALIVLALFTDTDGLGLAQILLALALPSLVPLGLGYTALRAAESSLR